MNAIEIPEGNRGWTPAMAARFEPAVVELEDDYEARLGAPLGEHVRHRLRFALGGIPVEVGTDSDGIAEFLHDAYGTFADSMEPAVRIELAETAGEFPFSTLVGTMMTYPRGQRVVAKF